MSQVTVYAPGAQVDVFTRVVPVATVSALTAALAVAIPGDCIVAAPGIYVLPSQLVINRSGTPASPIGLFGAGNATIIDTNQKGLFLDASYFRLSALRLTNFNTVGLWLRGVTGTVIDGVEIDHTANEALAIKNGSNRNIIRNCVFHDTGIVHPQFGEGVYLGNSGNTGSPLDFGVTDNQLLSNRFGPNVRAASVMLCEGADRTLIKGNAFDGTGTVYQPGQTSALIACRANDTMIDSNFLQFGAIHGVSFIKPVDARVMSGNVAQNNTIDLRDTHQAQRGSSIPYGFQFQAGTVNPMGAVVKCNNTMQSGLLCNYPCTL